MHRLPAALALVLLSSSCPGCEEEEPVDAREFVEAVFQASFVCFPSFLAEAEPVFVRAQAEAQIEVGIVGFERSLANENVEFSRAAYDACLDAARGTLCDVLAADQGACASVFRGKLNDGDACAENVECATGLSCFQERDACGVCRPLAINGDSCADRNCVDGSFCDDGTCRPEPAPARFAAGDACDPVSNCGGILAGLACVENTCASMTVVGEGEACQIGPGAALLCKDSATTHFCDNNVCTRRPALDEECFAGTTCDVTQGICVDGTCADEGQAGDACASPLQCRLGNTCEDGTCVAFDDVPEPPVCE